MLVFPPNLNAETLTPKRTLLGGGAFGRCFGHEGAALMNGTSVLTKGTPQSSLALPTPRGHSEKTWAVHQAERRPECNRAGPRSQTSSLQNCEKQTSLLISYPVCGTSYSSPHRRRQDLYLLYDSFTQIQFTYHTIQPVKVVFNIFTKLCNNHYNLILGHFVPPKRNPAPSESTPIPPILFPSHKQLLVYALALQICLFWTFHIDGIIQHVAFCGWLLSLSMMFSRAIRVTACLSPPFPFIAECYSIVRVDHPLFTPSSADEHLGWGLGFTG